MMARIVTQKPDPGNRVGLHYSPFQQSSPIRAPSIQLLARARSTQNRILEQPIREVGLTAAVWLQPPPVRNMGSGVSVRRLVRSSWPNILFYRVETSYLGDKLRIYLDRISMVKRNRAGVSDVYLLRSHYAGSCPSKGNRRFRRRPIRELPSITRTPRRRIGPPRSITGRANTIRGTMSQPRPTSIRPRLIATQPTPTGRAGKPGQRNNLDLPGQRCPGLSRRPREPARDPK